MHKKEFWVSSLTTRLENWSCHWAVRGKLSGTSTCTIDPRALLFLNNANWRNSWAIPTLNLPKPTNLIGYDGSRSAWTLYSWRNIEGFMEAFPSGLHVCMKVEKFHDSFLFSDLWLHSLWDALAGSCTFGYGSSMLFSGLHWTCDTLWTLQFPWKDSTYAASEGRLPCLVTSGLDLCFLLTTEFWFLLWSHNLSTNWDILCRTWKQVQMLITLRLW